MLSPRIKAQFTEPTGYLYGWHVLAAIPIGLVIAGVVVACDKSSPTQEPSSDRYDGRYSVILEDGTSVRCIGLGGSGGLSCDWVEYHHRHGG